MSQQLRQKFNLTTFEDGETTKDYELLLNGMAAYLAMLSEEVKYSEITVKMLHSLPPCFKQITIAIKKMLNLSMMSVVDLIERLKEAFEEASVSLQHDGKLYLTEEEVGGARSREQWLIVKWVIKKGNR
jgi:hypothetical protein